MRPGFVGVVDIKDESSLPFRVVYEERTYWYRRDALVAENQSTDLWVPVVSCTSDTIFCSSGVPFKEGACIEFIGPLFGGLSKQKYFVDTIAPDRLSFSVSHDNKSEKIQDLLSETASAYVRMVSAAPFIQWAPTDVPILSRENDFLVTPFNPRLQTGAALFFVNCTVMGIEEGKTYFVDSVEGGGPGDSKLKFSIRDSKQRMRMSRGKLGIIRLVSRFDVAVHFSDNIIRMCSYEWSSKRSKTPWESAYADSYLSVKSCCIESAAIERIGVPDSSENKTPVDFTCCAWDRSRFAFASRDGRVRVCSFGDPSKFSMNPHLTIDLNTEL